MAGTIQEAFAEIGRIKEAMQQYHGETGTRLKELETSMVQVKTVLIPGVQAEFQ